MEIYDKLRDPVALIIFVTTLLLPIIVGFLTLRRTKNQSDFFVGGRAMDKFVVALSAVSSGRSGWLVLGVSGTAYLMGTSAVWAVVGYITVEMFQFIYIGRKLRTQTGAFDNITLLDYFESRFNDKYLLRITGAVIIAIFITAYVAAQFNAGAKSLSTALDIPILTSLIISGLLIMVYMVMGGYVAVAYNDVVRAVIMLIGLVVLPIVGLIKIGGFNVLLDTLSQLNPTLIDPFSLSIGAFFGFVGIGLGSPGQPHIVVRYMSIDDPDKLKYSTVIGTTWNVIMAWGAVFIGLLARILAPEVKDLPNADKEMVYLVLSSQYFGPVFYGLLVGGVFAAILSTADSQLLVVASTFVRDIYEKIIYERTRKRKAMPQLSESRKLMLSRLVVFISGIMAIILAYLAQETIFWLVLFAWGGLGASFGTSLIFSLYWKRTGKYGIFAGMIVGTVLTITWKLYLKETTGIYELIPAFVGSALAIFIVSLLTRKKNK
jgi:sodium/proline symporter